MVSCDLFQGPGPLLHSAPLLMLNQLPRYLVPFRVHRSLHRFTDILVLGGGLAGLRAALSTDPRLDVLVVTKDKLRQSNSTYAQGGIASVIDPEDRLEWHIRDTLLAGADLCDESIVKMVVEQGPRCIASLIEMGTLFDSIGDELKLGREGGHSHNRIIHALGDATGQEIMRAVIARVQSSENIAVAENAFTLDLLTEDNVCRGALVRIDGQIQLIWAKQTILATGGAGQLYRETTNPPVATADGHAMAIRAGAEVRDMEFMQFHPTLLYIAGGSRSLISEAVRGEGALLLDRDGHRFMPDYDERAELAPRDVVSQAIVDQMEKTQHPNVYLSLKHLDPQEVRSRFPGISQTCQQYGLDIALDPIPVRPGAHYMIGGLTVDATARTSLEGLWAAGEVTSSGLHGANRLASNSLLEGVVFGELAGRNASRAALEMNRLPPVPNLSHPGQNDETALLDLEDIRNSLKSLMWRAVGVKRGYEELIEAEQTVQHWKKLLVSKCFGSPAGWELQNMLAVAALMIDAAKTREESRGVHFREDHPAQKESWRRSICFRGSQRSLSPVLIEQRHSPLT